MLVFVGFSVKMKFFLCVFSGVWLKTRLHVTTYCPFHPNLPPPPPRRLLIVFLKDTEMTWYEKYSFRFIWLSNFELKLFLSKVIGQILIFYKILSNSNCMPNTAFSKYFMEHVTSFLEFSKPLGYFFIPSWAL